MQYFSRKKKNKILTLPIPTLGLLNLQSSQDLMKHSVAVQLMHSVAFFPASAQIIELVIKLSVNLDQKSKKSYVFKTERCIYYV